MGFVFWAIFRLVLALGGLALFVYLLYLFIFKSYGGYLRRRYRFKLFNFIGLFMLLAAWAYATLNVGWEIIPFGQDALEFLNSLIIIADPETAYYSAISFVSTWPFDMKASIFEDFVEIVTYMIQSFMLIAPLIPVYALYALIRTFNIVHTLVSTLIMTLGALIAGSVGGLISAFAIGAVIVYLVFMFAVGEMGNQGSSVRTEYKCPVCGGDPSTCGCRG